MIRVRGLLGVIALIGLLVSVLPLIAIGEARFEDIAGNRHAAEIEMLAGLGVTRGCNPPSNTRYCPEQVVTRGQLAAFLVRALDLPKGVDREFTDTIDHVFSDDISRLASAGVTRGCNPPANTRFCPDETVSRGQMAAFLVRALDIDSLSPRSFLDTDGHRFESEIGALASAGLTRGCNPPANTRFCPDQPVRRDQMATFLIRARDLLPISNTSSTSSTSPTSSTSSTSTTSSTSSTSSTSTTTTAPTTTTTSPPLSGAFLEQNGVVVIEVESVADVDPWDEGMGFGEVGTFYFPNASRGLTTPGQSVLTYDILISEPGQYVLTVRSRRDRTLEETCDPNDPLNPRDPALLPDEECVENGERNDVFIRMDDEQWDAKKSKGTTHAAFGVWGWIDKWRETESCPSPDPVRTCEFRAFSWILEPGIHTVWVSRRAEQIKIDRIILYRYDGDPFNLNAVRADRPPGVSTPESPRTP